MRRKRLLLCMVICAMLTAGGCGNRTPETKTTSAETTIQQETTEVATVATETEQLTPEATEQSSQEPAELDQNPFQTELELNGAKLLLTAPAIFESEGKNLAIECKVYVLAGDQQNYQLDLQSGGTSYAIRQDKDGLYAAAGHWIARYHVQDGKVVQERSVEVTFDKDGNESYTAIVGDQSQDATAEEWDQLWAAYEAAEEVVFQGKNG